MTCTCGSGETYAVCCEPLIDGRTPAPTPEHLMRSRFVAYALGNLDYVIRTTDPQRRLEIDHAAVRAWMDDAKFTKLDILGHEENGTKGMVEFVAHYEDGAGAAHAHHEVSRFRKQGGLWYFSQGRIKAEKA